MGPDRAGPHRVHFSFDGTPLEASRGMAIGGALLANGIVCRCEETRWSEIGAALAGGARDVRAVAEMTRCGTGYCQGRVCGPALQYAVSAAAGRPGA